MSAYLKVLNGSERKSEHALSRTYENLIGRGKDCHIQIDDPRASRVHARVVFQDGGWIIVDSGSRNGTLVNGSKTDSATLDDGTRVCIGDTEMVFSNSGVHESVTREQISVEKPLLPSKSFEVPGPPSKEFGVKAFESLRQSGREAELTALHEFSLKSNALESEKELIDLAIQVLSERTEAEAVFFFLSNEFGELSLAGQLTKNPDYEPKVSEQLSEIVTQQIKAVWVQEGVDPSIVPNGIAKKSGFTDAICVPILEDKKAIGALHLYRKQGKFRSSDFDFSIAIASIVGVALVRVLSAQSLQADLGRLQAKNADFDELLGKSKPMEDLKGRISRIAKAAGCILIRGESGAGKELVARAIHRNSSRASRPMLSVNCAAIPDELMESQLFGHVKGAFTGADRDHVGYFQQANKGTLFLDEVGELNLEGQAKLLRILEGHPFLPVGATKEVRVDVRVISATNRDLKEFVAERRFREDLYYRLSVFELQIPPLRERGEDIDLLVEFFLEHFKKQNGRRHLRISREAMDVLRAYRWPGNVRQLRNVMDSAVVLADGLEIQPQDLSLRDVGNAEDSSGRQPKGERASNPLLNDSSQESDPSTIIMPRSGVRPEESKPTTPEGNPPVQGQALEFDTLNVETWEQRLIQEALRRTQGNIPAAAELMGISRATLYRKLEKGNPPVDPAQ